MLAGLRPNRRLVGMFIGSFAVPTQMKEPDFALCPSTPEAHGEGKRSLRLRTRCSFHHEKS